MLEISNTIYGTSSIELNENENTVLKQIAQMNANIPKNGDYSINKVIQDRYLFEKNKDIVLDDFKQFENYVYNLVSNQEVGNGKK